MILYRILTCVCCGCIYMSYASRQCRSTGATPQSIPNPASALFVTSPSGSTAREGMFPVFPSGVSLSQAGSALKTPCSRQPSQDCLYRQTTIHTDPPTPRLCRSHSAHVERHRQSRFNCDARSRPEAWLTSGQPAGRARFISNISSIAYWIPSSLKPTKSWSLTSGGPHAILRR
jgi:hypothetical protein